MKLEDLLIERIKLRLEAVNKSATAVSTEAGLGKGALQAILSRTSESPRLDTVSRLTKPLECSMSYLIGATDDPKQYRSATEALTLDEMPASSIALAQSVLRLSSEWVEWEYPDTFLAADDRVLVRDSRYPGVEVALFELREDTRFDEGLRSGDLLVAMTNLSVNSIALHQEALIVRRLSREGDKRTNVNVSNVLVDGFRFRIDEYIIAGDAFNDAFINVISPTTPLVIPKKDKIDLGGGVTLELLGLVIRATRRYKRSTTF